MKPIVADVNLVACCGLYCGACIAQIRREGLQGHAEQMADAQLHSIRR